MSAIRSTKTRITRADKDHVRFEVVDGNDNMVVAVDMSEDTALGVIAQLMTVSNVTTAMIVDGKVIAW